MLNGKKTKRENTPQRESTAGVQHHKIQRRKDPRIWRKPGFESILHSAGRSCFIIYLDLMSHLPRQHFQLLFISPALCKQNPGALCNAYVRGAKGTLPRLCSCSGATTGSLGHAAEENAAIPTRFPWTKHCLSSG